MNDSTHWYSDTCEAVFQVPNKSKGGMRPTRITDAMERKLLPSVTTILGVLARPQLDRWKLEQVAKACLADAISGYFTTDEELYCRTMIEDAFKQVDTAADLGTAIHEAIEQHFTGKPYNQALLPYVEAVDKWVKDEEVVFEKHELRLASKSHGFAGTTDAVIKCKRGHGILDFKSRKTQPGKPATPYDTHPMQIAAYDVAYFHVMPEPDRIGCNLFISTTEPGRVDATWYDSKELTAAWNAFAACRDLWVHLRGYDPRIME